MIAVSLNVGGGVRLIKTSKTVHVHAKHYKHNEDGRTAPGVCGNGSVPLSHSGNVFTRIGIHTHTHVEWLEQLFMVQKAAVKREFEAGLRHTTTGKLSLLTQQ